MCAPAYSHLTYVCATQYMLVCVSQFMASQHYCRHSTIMSNEGASIRAMSDISDRTAFNNGHRQQRQTDGERKKEKKKRMQRKDGATAAKDWDR